jgi:hypothetical protein
MSDPAVTTTPEHAVGWVVTGAGAGGAIGSIAGVGLGTGPGAGTGAGAGSDAGAGTGAGTGAGAGAAAGAGAIGLGQRPRRRCFLEQRTLVTRFFALALALAFRATRFLAASVVFEREEEAEEAADADNGAALSPTTTARRTERILEKSRAFM